MNKQELIGTVADTSGLGKGDATKAVEAVFDAISTALKKGDEVRLVGFGTFSVSKRKASTGRNPRTGEPVAILARRVVSFHASPKLKEQVQAAVALVDDHAVGEPAEVHLGGERIMGTAMKRQIRGGVCTQYAERLSMVELEVMSFLAAHATLVDCCERSAMTSR